MGEFTRTSYEFGPFRFHAHGSILLRDGQRVPLTPKAAELLCALLEHHGEVVTKEELHAQLWPNTFVEDGSLTYHVHLVRKALRNGANGGEFVETVSRRGYRFAAPVKELPRASEAPADAGRSLEVPIPGPVPAQDLVRGLAEQPDDRRVPRQRHRWIRTLALAGLGVVPLLVAVSFHRAPPPRVVSFAQLTRDGGNKGSNWLFTDGARVYFLDVRESGRTLMAVPARGGRPEPVWGGRHDAAVLGLSGHRSEALVLRRPCDDTGCEVWAFL